MLILVMVLITAIESKLGQCLSLRPGAYCLGRAGWPVSSKNRWVPVWPVSSKSWWVPFSRELELQAYATIYDFHIRVLEEKLRSVCFQHCISPVLWAPFLHGFPLLWQVDLLKTPWAVPSQECLPFSCLLFYSTHLLGLSICFLDLSPWAFAGCWRERPPWPSLEHRDPQP